MDALAKKAAETDTPATSGNEFDGMLKREGSGQSSEN
jgi:hypothetical protein